MTDLTLNLNTVKSSGSKKFTPALALEADTYMCRVVQVVTVGLQEQRPFQGEAKGPKDEVQITYEFTTEFLLDDAGNPDESKPRWLSEFVPINSLDSDLAKLTKRYKAIDPKDESKGNLFDLVGRPCMVTVTKNPGVNGKPEKNYIAGVAPAPKGIPFPPLVNAPKVFHIDAPDLAVFETLPEWLRTKCTAENLRYAGSVLEKALTGKSSSVPVAAPVAATTQAAAVKPAVDEPAYDDDLPF